MMFAIVLIALIITAIGRGTRIRNVRSPLNWVLACWGFMPLTIGLAYSILHAPVIQYSLMLFSFPYILLLLLKGLGELNKWTTMALCALLALISTVTLIIERHHYDLFYTSKYEAIMEGVLAAHKEDDKGDHLAIIDTPNEVITFYEKLWNIAPGAMPHVQLRIDPERTNLDSLLRNPEVRTVFYGSSNGAPAEQLPRIQNYFPDLIERKDYTEGQTFLFQRSAPDHDKIDDRNFRTMIRPGDERPADHGNVPMYTWQINSDIAVGYDVDSIPYWDLTDREYGILLELRGQWLYTERDDELEVILQLDGADSTSDVAVAFDFVRDDSTVFYRTGELRSLQLISGTVPLIVAASIRNAGSGSSVIARAYVCNRTKGPIRVREMEVYRRDANPIRYGAFEPIQKLGKYR